MKFRILDDAYVEVLATLMMALLPMFTIGWLGMELLLYTTIVVGVFLFGVCISRMIHCIRKMEVDTTSRVLSITVTYFSSPYFFLLSYLILRINGIRSDVVLWFVIVSLVVAIPVAVKEMIGPKNR